MASILDKYGIKEVADVTFYEIGTDGKAGAPVLYLDTLKVSTIEQTAEEAEAKGGKGNAPLIIWDYGREITVDIQDALFSMKSMAIMFGDANGANSAAKVIRTFEWTADSASTAPTGFTDANGTFVSISNASVYTVTESSSTAVTTFTVGTKYLVTGEVGVTGSEIEISPNTFPGAYYVTGDTFARSEKDGKDEMFQFVIPKAKVQSEQTITLEAEGDPTVFNFKLRVLRPNNGGAMMKLIKYTAGTANG